MAIPLQQDATSFEHFRPAIDQALRELFVGASCASRPSRPVPGASAMAALLGQAFAQLFGEKRSAQERTRFLLVAAPLMRAIAIEYANAANTTSARMNTAGVEQWLQRLESFDPQCVQMIDLHYFAGLNARDIAAALNVSPQTVLRDLRFAKAWLRARMQWISAGSTRD